MDILARARRLETSLSRSLDDAVKRFARPAERRPLETLHAIVDAIAERLEPAGRGRYVFPFNRVEVRIAAPQPEDQSRFEAVFAGPPSLQRRALDRLQQAGCTTEGVLVETSFVREADPQWRHAEFDLVCTQVVEPVSLPMPSEDESAATVGRLRLTVVAGAAQKGSYAFTLERINLGRCAEVRDRQQRLVRSNHVAFVDGGPVEPNHTVSRRHAHIAHAAGLYRLCDDGSAHGTSVVRHGKTIAVPTGSRGVRLQSGDEIVLGDARLRVRILPM